MVRFWSNGGWTLDRTIFIWKKQIIPANCPIFPSIGDWSSCWLGMLKSRGAEPFQRAHPMGYKNVRRWSYSELASTYQLLFLAIKPNAANRSAGESLNLPWWVYISRHHDLPTFFLAIKPNVANRSVGENLHWLGGFIFHGADETDSDEADSDVSFSFVSKGVAKALCALGPTVETVWNTRNINVSTWLMV